MDYSKWLGPGCAKPPEFGCGVWASLEIAEQLKGKPMDELAFYILSGFRPSYIRVIPHDGSEHMDGRCWRISVYLDEEGLIKRVTQEMEFRVGDEIGCGSGLLANLAYGKDDPKAVWENLDCESVCYGFGQAFKRLRDGTIVPYPE